MALINCADQPVLRGQIHMGTRGAWYAELSLATATLPSGQITIVAADGFTLHGTVIEPSRVFLDAAFVRLVGGAGGLTKTLSPAAYQNPQAGDILSAFASDVGETLSSTIDGSIKGVQFPYWTTTAEKVPLALDNLCAEIGAALAQPVTWRILEDGKLWVGVDTWPDLELPETSDVVWQDPSQGKLVLGVPTLFVLPGVTLKAQEIPDSRIAGVDHWIEPEKIRSWAWT